MKFNIEKLIPKNTRDIDILTNKSINQANCNIRKLLKISANNRTFENTVYALDLIESTFYESVLLLQMIESVHPNAKMRVLAYQNSLKLKEFAIDKFLQNKKIYQILKFYSKKIAKKEDLNDEQKYFIQNRLRSYKINGLDLNRKNIENLKNIKKKLEEYKSNFKHNISNYSQKLEVNLEELEGLSLNFINNLEKNSQNKYILPINTNTYNQILESCSNSSTRRKVWTKFYNTAYPNNKAILLEIIKLRNQWAQLLKYNNFAELDLSTQMANDIKTVENFIFELIDKAETKFNKEIDILKQNLPKDIKLNIHNQFKSWDFPFVKANYKNKYLNLNEEEISFYFTFENTLKELLNIYESFFDIKFKEENNLKLWDNNVQCLSVYQNNLFLGNIILDLFPRFGKTTYACFIDIIPKNYKNHKTALGLVIANFNLPQNNNPSFLKLSNIRTFFHELGHALHATLSSTLMSSFAGTRVKCDFVEMPSQMLEEWLWNKDMLRKISKHYITKQPLPDEIIEKIIELKHFDSGYWIKRQAALSLISLELFKSHCNKNIEEIQKNIFSKILHAIEYDDNNRDFASFWHLTDYGAKYYSYLWSKIFSLDLFYKIKQKGLLNSCTGKEYTKKILSKGGSVDPKALIKRFLERDPNTNAFFQDMHV